MKKLIFTFLMFLTLSLSAQDAPVKFLGIPVDGNKKELVAKLKEKGFVYNNENKCLNGKFNGNMVDVFFHTNNDNVDRIIVRQSQTIREYDIKVRFNNLVRQFEKNKKYVSDKNNQYIDDKVDIEYEILVKNKRFQAIYHQTYTDDELESIQKYLYDNYDSLISRLVNNEDFDLYGLDKYDINFEVGNKDFDKDEIVNKLLLMIKSKYIENNNVWFMIDEESYYGYNILLYYDNLKNVSDGEDL